MTEFSLDSLEELKQDFQRMIKQIDFSKYDPRSQLFMTVLSIGLMYMSIKAITSTDDVAEELNGARKYMLNYLSSNDTNYKDMAKDELRHAGILIKKLYEKADFKEKVRLETYENEAQELLARIENWTGR